MGPEDASHVRALDEQLRDPRISSGWTLQLLIPKALVGFRNSDTLRQTHRHLPEQRTGLAICGEDLRRFRKP